LQLLALESLLASCQLLAGAAGVIPDERMTIDVANGTSLGLELRVNVRDRR
jgi:hypothetical protein